MFEALRKLIDGNGEVSFTVRVHPGASRTRVQSVMTDGTIKLDIAAVPEDGKANEELIHFLSKAFGVPRSHIEIVKGQMAKTKAVRICK